MRLIQFHSDSGQRQVGVVLDTAKVRLVRAASVYELAIEAGRLGRSIADLVERELSDQTVDYEQLIAKQRLAAPLDHPDSGHLYITGTGLTHLGSAQARDSMHSANDQAAQAELSDSMKLFQMGVDGGKPPDGTVGVQPEWFYKGNGSSVVAPEQAIVSPTFALDGGEEAELVGLYVISESGDVLRVGFALGNEFSDHIMERQNYLYLAHSKLRKCSFGPELLLGDPPSDIQGTVRLLRDGGEIWAEPFVTGEDNMSYTLANLEHHHFKYDVFRQPGDVHCHYFGTATLSFSSGVKTESGDVVEISAPGFGRPLRNRLDFAKRATERTSVIPL